MAPLPRTLPSIPRLFLLQRKVWISISSSAFAEEAPSSLSSWHYSFSTLARGKNRGVGEMVSSLSSVPPQAWVKSPWKQLMGLALRVWKENNGDG